MRPKRVVLLVDAEEERLAERRFVLEVRGFRVLTATGAAEALNILDGLVGGWPPELLVIDLPDEDGDELVKRAQRLNPELPSLQLNEAGPGFGQRSPADAVLRRGCSMAEMLEGIRIRLIHKHSPRKCPAAVSVVAAAPPDVTPAATRRAA